VNFNKNKISSLRFI